MIIKVFWGQGVYKSQPKTIDLLFSLTAQRIYMLSLYAVDMKKIQAKATCGDRSFVWCIFHYHERFST